MTEVLQSKARQMKRPQTSNPITKTSYPAATHSKKTKSSTVTKAPKKKKKNKVTYFSSSSDDELLSTLKGKGAFAQQSTKGKECIVEHNRKRVTGECLPKKVKIPAHSRKKKPSQSTVQLKNKKASTVKTNLKIKKASAGECLPKKVKIPLTAHSRKKKPSQSTIKLKNKKASSAATNAKKKQASPVAVASSSSSYDNERLNRRIQEESRERKTKELNDDMGSFSDSSFSPLNSDYINSSDSENSSFRIARKQKADNDPIRISWEKISRKQNKIKAKAGVKRKKEITQTQIKRKRQMEPNSDRLGKSSVIPLSQAANGETDSVLQPEQVSHDQDIPSVIPLSQAANRETDSVLQPEQVSHDQDIQTAIDQSIQEATYENKLRSIHGRRLDRLLESNGLERSTVSADGNCFFEAALYYLDFDDKEELREALCSHIDDNFDEYKCFLGDEGTEHAHSSRHQYDMQVEKLRRNGQWSAQIGDILPKALADFTGRSVRMFRSTIRKPVLDLKPTLGIIDTEKQSILLAHLCPPGLPEHYDLCRRKSVESSHNSETDNVTLTQQVTPQSSHSSSQDDLNVSVPSSSTPRKNARFMTPPKKDRFRKRKATPDNWKKNVRKRLKLTGKEHLNTKGKTIPARHVKLCDCSKCRHKCNEAVSEDTRQHIFESFWNLGSYDRQKDFICARVQEKKTRTYLDESDKPKAKRRQIYRVYSFEVNENTQYVCKTFFLSTLSIGEAYVNHALSNKEDGVFTGTEMRGKHKPHNKTNEELILNIKKHIESFPTVEGHYTRRESTRQYLGPELNISRMYQLYLEERKSQGADTVTQAMYRKIFNEEYNFSFHRPKKDQCSVCTKYEDEKRKDSITQDVKDAFDRHQKRKVRAREEKEKDKLSAKNATDLHVATFDLQAVLYTPCTLVSQIFYARKLNCYNLTCYNLSSKSGSCFLWSEVDAKRGSCEIATCLRLHLQSLPQTITHVVLYSDTCTGQNRNQFLAASLIHLVATNDHISTIDQKFLESGHTQMECDAMHSAIEFAKSKTSIYVPSQWDTVLQMARRKDPYTVVPLKYYDVWDFKEIAAQRMLNTKIDTDGKRVNWMQMRWLRYIQEEPDTLLFKYDYDEEEFHRIKLSGNRRGRRSVGYGNELPRKYTAKQPISLAKKKDLLRLCTTGVIPSEYTEYYKSIPSAEAVKDILPEPDAEEDDDDSDAD